MDCTLDVCGWKTPLLFPVTYIIHMYIRISSMYMCRKFSYNTLHAVGFDVPTLKELNDHVRPKVAPKWYDLGVELLSMERVDKLDVIRHDNPGDAEACCTEMFKFWLQEDTMASWTKLVRALRSPAVDQIVLADEIEEVFVTGNVRIVTSP